MADEADSRHTVQTLRWGETAAEVPDVGVVEPPGGKKDTGWLPGVDVPVGEWWNWLHWTSGVFNRYVERSRGLMWTKNHVMAGAAAGEGEVTDGVGLTVDVASARVWIVAGGIGAMYEVPAATNLALAAAHATLHRTDLVIAEIVALLPVYSIVTGTPAASPDPPAVPAGAVALAEVDVLATSTTPDTIRDRREFGAIDLDAVRATDVFRAGSIGGGNFMLEVDGTDSPGGSPVVRLGDSSDPIAQVEDFGTIFRVKPESVTFFTAIRRKYDLPAVDFMITASTAPGSPNLSTGSTTSWIGTAASDELAAAVRVPNGCEITEARAYVKRDTNAEMVRFRLWKATKGTGARTQLGSADTPLGSGGTGDLTLVISGLSEVVTQASTYFVTVEFLGAGLDQSLLYAAEVEYDETNPFDGI